MSGAVVISLSVVPKIPNPISPAPKSFAKRCVVAPEGVRNPLAVREKPLFVKVLVGPKSKLLPFSWKVKVTAFACVANAPIAARAIIIVVNLCFIGLLPWFLFL